MWYYKTASPDRYDILKGYAKENRKNATVAETVLWQHLRNKQMGHKFYRQHIIGDYIVDFLCQDEGLIIEVDGAYHTERLQEEDDHIRELNLQKMGFRILRFTNEEVMCNIEDVLNQISDYFE